jgi:hypothetical protein
VGRGLEAGRAAAGLGLTRGLAAAEGEPVTWTVISWIPFPFAIDLMPNTAYRFRHQKEHSSHFADYAV